MKVQKAAIGITVDPDVDRLAFVCEDGSMFGEEYTLVAVADYVLKHLAISIDDKKNTLVFIGYEQIEEGIYCYFQVSSIAGLKKIAITDNIMYDYKKDQVSVIHVTVGGKRQSTKLTNLTDKVVFNF